MNNTFEIQNLDLQLKTLYPQRNRHTPNHPLVDGYLCQLSNPRTRHAATVWLEDTQLIHLLDTPKSSSPSPTQPTPTATPNNNIFLVVGDTLYRFDEPTMPPAITHLNDTPVALRLGSRGYSITPVTNPTPVSSPSISGTWVNESVTLSKSWLPHLARTCHGISSHRHHSRLHDAIYSFFPSSPRSNLLLRIYNTILELYHSSIYYIIYSIHSIKNMLSRHHPASPEASSSATSQAKGKNRKRPHHHRNRKGTHSRRRPNHTSKK